ncbi:hypothetical protein O3P69_009828 [Scylla paramamosain]|uniref:Calponin-homology (CH) domain-containing protein n=1 Tax=Scylla paramamosain TaxID=85552 RepID=A0AAW0SN90_SCYPA
MAAEAPARSSSSEETATAWAWVCAAWAAVWTRLFSYLALAWLYVWTVLPLWKREKNLAEWVRRCVPSQPLEDLQRDLADGVVLCGLLEAVLPGACPRFDLLAKNNPEINFRIASRLAATFLGVTEVTEGDGEGWERRRGQERRRRTEEEEAQSGSQIPMILLASSLDGMGASRLKFILKYILEITENFTKFTKFAIQTAKEATGSGAALTQFLRAVRYAALRRQVLGGPPLTQDTVAQTLGINQVVVRGMGLQLGLVGRWARFTLYMDNGSEGSLVVEVCSDRGEYGCCRVTGSPGATTAKVKSQAHQQVPLECDVQGCKVRVAWLPMQQTRYTLVLSIYGQHILSSPYTVHVDESQHSSPARKWQLIRHVWDSDSESEYEGILVPPDKESALTSREQAGARRFLSILRRRVVRRVLHIGDHHVVLRGSECIDRSSRAREALQHMRKSAESLDLDDFAPREASSAPPSRRLSLQWEVGVSVGPIEEKTKEEEESVQEGDCDHNSYLQENIANSIEGVDGEAVKEVASEMPTLEATPQSSDTPEILMLTNKTELTPTDILVDPDCHDHHREKSDFPICSAENCEPLAESPQGTGSHIQEPLDATTTTHTAGPVTEAALSAAEEAAPTTVTKAAPAAAEEATCMLTKEVTSTPMTEVNNSYPAALRQISKPKGNADRKSRRRRRKRLKGAFRVVTKDYDHICTIIMNMCDFIIEHSPRKEALKAVRVASRILGYGFSDTSESSYSHDLSGEEEEQNSIVDDEILESVVEEWGAVLVRQGSGDHVVATEHDGEEAKIIDVSELEENSFEDSISPVTLIIPEVVVVPQEDTLAERVPDDNGSQLLPELDRDSSIMNYLQTIDEVTEPNSMVEDMTEELQKRYEDYFDTEDKTSCQGDVSDGDGEEWEAAASTAEDLVSRWPGDLGIMDESKKGLQNGLKPLQDVFMLLQPLEGSDDLEASESEDENKHDHPQITNSPQHSTEVLPRKDLLWSPQDSQGKMEEASPVNPFAQTTEPQQVTNSTLKTEGESISQESVQLTGEHERLIEEPAQTTDKPEQQAPDTVESVPQPEALAQIREPPDATAGPQPQVTREVLPSHLETTGVLKSPSEPPSEKNFDFFTAGFSSNNSKQGAGRDKIRPQKSLAIQKKCLILKDLLKFSEEQPSLASLDSPKEEISGNGASLPAAGIHITTEETPFSSLEEKLVPEISTPVSPEPRRIVKGSVSKFRTLFESRSINEISFLQREETPIHNKGGSCREVSQRENIEQPVALNGNQKVHVTESPIHETEEEVESLSGGDKPKAVTGVLPKLSPDMDLLNQLRVDAKSGSSGEDVPNETVTQDVKEVEDKGKIRPVTSKGQNIFTSMQKSLQDKIKMTTKSDRIPYSSYVRPAMILLETERRVSRLRSVFEQPCATPAKRSLPHKTTRYIVSGSPAASPPLDRKNAFPQAHFGEKEEMLNNLNDAHPSMPEDDIKQQRNTTETLEYSVLHEEHENVRQLPPETSDGAQPKSEVDQGREISISLEFVLETQKEDNGVSTSYQQDQSVQHPQPLEGELQKKSYKLVAALETMEKDIKEMQESVERLNRHYPIIPPDDVDLPRNLQQLPRHGKIVASSHEETLTGTKSLGDLSESKESTKYQQEAEAYEQVQEQKESVEYVTEYVIQMKEPVEQLQKSVEHSRQSGESQQEPQEQMRELQEPEEYTELLQESQINTEQLQESVEKLHKSEPVKQLQVPEEKLHKSDGVVEQLQEQEESVEQLQEQEGSVEQLQEQEEPFEKLQEESVEQLQEQEDPAEQLQEQEEPVKQLQEQEESVKQLQEQEGSVEQLQEQEEPVEQLQEQEGSVEQLQEQKEPIENLQELEKTVKQLQEPEELVEQLQEQEKPVEQLQEQEKPVEQLQEQEKPVEQLQQQEKTVEQLDEPEERAEQLQEPEEPVEQLQEPEEPVEQLQEPEEPVEQLQEPEESVEQQQEPEDPVEQLEKPEPIEQLQEPEKPVEQMQEPEEPVEQLQELEELVEQLREPEEPVEQLQQPEESVEQLQETEEPVEQLQEPGEPVEQPQESKRIVECLKEQELVDKIQRPIERLQERVEYVKQLQGPEKPVKQLKVPKEFVGQQEESEELVEHLQKPAERVGQLLESEAIKQLQKIQHPIEQLQEPVEQQQESGEPDEKLKKSEERVEQLQEPGEVIEQLEEPNEHLQELEVVEQLQEFVEHLQEPKDTVEQLKEHNEQLQESNETVEQLQESREGVEQLQEPIRRLQKPEEIIEQLQEPREIFEQLEEPVEQLQEQGEVVEQLQESIESVEQQQDSVESVEQLQESVESVEQLQESIESVEQLQDSVETVEQLQDSVETVEQLQESIESVEQLQESIESVEQLQESVENAEQLQESVEITEQLQEQGETLEQLEKPVEWLQESEEFKQMQEPQVLQQLLQPFERLQEAGEEIAGQLQEPQVTEQVLVSTEQLQKSEEIVEQLQDQEKVFKQLQELTEQMQESEEIAEHLQELVQLLHETEVVEQLQEPIEPLQELDETVEHSQEQGRVFEPLQESNDQLEESKVVEQLLEPEESNERLQEQSQELGKPSEQLPKPEETGEQMQELEEPVEQVHESVEQLQETKETTQELQRSQAELRRLPIVEQMIASEDLADLLPQESSIPEQLIMSSDITEPSQESMIKITQHVVDKAALEMTQHNEDSSETVDRKSGVVASIEPDLPQRSLAEDSDNDEDFRPVFEDALEDLPESKDTKHSSQPTGHRTALMKLGESVFFSMDDDSLSWSENQNVNPRKEGTSEIVAEVHECPKYIKEPIEAIMAIEKLTQQETNLETSRTQELGQPVLSLHTTTEPQISSDIITEPHIFYSLVKTEIPLDSLQESETPTDFLGEPETSTDLLREPETPENLPGEPEISTDPLGEPETPTDLLLESVTQTDLLGEPETPKNLLGEPEISTDLLGEPETPADLLVEPVTPTDLLGEPEIPKNLLGGPEISTDLLGEPETPADLLVEPMTPTDLLGEPETPKNLLGEPEISTDLLGEPETPKNLLGEPEISTDLLGEPESPADLLVEPMTPTDLLGEPETPKNLLGEPEISTDLLGEPETPKNLLGEPEISTDLLGEPESPADLLVEPMTPTDLLGEPEAPKNLLGEPEISTDLLGELETPTNLLVEPVTPTDLGKTETLVDLLQEPKTSADLLQEAETSTDIIQGPEKSTDLLREPKTSIDFLQEPETPTDLLGEPETPANHLGEPETSTDPLGEPEISTDLLGEPEIPTNLLEESEIPTDPLGEPVTPTDLLGEAETPTYFLQEPETPTNLLREPDILTDLLGKPGTSTDLLVEPETSTDLLQEPETSKDLLQEPETPTDLLGEPETSTDLLKERETLTDHLGEPETPTDLLGEPETPADLGEAKTSIDLGVPETPKDLLGEPETSTDLFGEPETSTDLLQEPETTTELLEEPETPANLLREPEISTDLLRETVTSTDLLGGSQTSTDLLEEPETSSGHLQESEISLQLSEELEISRNFLREPETLTDLLLEPETSTELLEELGTSTDPLGKLGTLTDPRRESMDPLGEEPELLPVPETSTDSMGGPEPTDIKGQSKTPLCVLKEPETSTNVLEDVETKQTKTNEVPVSTIHLSPVVSFNPAGSTTPCFAIPGLVVRPPTSESEQQDSDEIATATTTSESDEVALDDISVDANTYISLQDDVALEFLSNQRITEGNTKEEASETEKPKLNIPTLNPPFFLEDDSQEEPELMDLDYSSNPSLESELVAPLPLDTETPLGPLDHHVEDLEEHRGSPWLMFTAISDYIRSRSPSPLSMFFTESVSQSVSRENDSLPPLDTNDSAHEPGEQHDSSSLLAQNDTTQSLSESVLFVQPPKSLPLTGVVHTALQDTPQEASDTLTSLTYETASEHASVGPSLPDLTPEEIPDLPPDSFRSQPLAGPPASNESAPSTLHYILPMTETAVAPPLSMECLGLHSTNEVGEDRYLSDTSYSETDEYHESKTNILGRLPDDGNALACIAAECNEEQVVSLSSQHASNSSCHEEAIGVDTTAELLEEKTSNFSKEVTVGNEETKNIITENIIDLMKETTDVLEEKTVVPLQENATNILKEEAVDIVQETIDIQREEATDFVEKEITNIREEDAANLVQETTNMQEEDAVDLVQETTNIQEEDAVDLVQETTNIQKDAVELVQETTNMQEEDAVELVQETTKIQEEEEEEEEEEDVGLVQETTNIQEEEDVSLLQETTNIQEEKDVGLVQETTNIQEEEDVGLVQETTNIQEEEEDVGLVQETTNIQEEEEDVGLVQETTNIQEEEKDVGLVQETTNIQEEEKDVGLVQETTNIQEEEKDVGLVQETTNIQEDAMDLVQETTDIQKKTIHIVQETISIMKEETIHIFQGDTSSIMKEAEEATDILSDEVVGLHKRKRSKGHQ